MKALLSAFLLLAGCADAVQAPSLAPRPIERSSAAQTPPAPPPKPGGADPALNQDAADLRTRAEAADLAFAAAIAQAEHGTGGAPGSEAWVARQTALSAAEIARGPALDALGALDALISRTVQSGGDTAPITAVRDAVQAMVTAQNARIVALTNR